MKKMATKNGSKKSGRPARKKAARSLPAKTMNADQAKRVKGGGKLDVGKISGFKY
jgi:hypothetical protein